MMLFAASYEYGKRRDPLRTMQIFRFNNASKTAKMWAHKLAHKIGLNMHLKQWMQ